MQVAENQATCRTRVFIKVTVFLNGSWDAPMRRGAEHIGCVRTELTHAADSPPGAIDGTMPVHRIAMRGVICVLAAQPDSRRKRRG